MGRNLGGASLHRHGDARRAHTLEPVEQAPALQAALNTLTGTEVRLELAKALTDLGTALRRDNQRVAARKALRDALDIATETRADALAAQLRDELRAAGAKSRRDRAHLRHTCASRLFAEGRNAVQVQRWLGHHFDGVHAGALRRPARR